MSAFAVFLLPLGVFACGVVLIVVLVVARARGRRQRADALGEWAARHGWGFVPRDDDVGRSRPCWPVRHGGRSAHVLRGPDGTVAFEWVYLEEVGGRTGDSTPSRVERAYAVVSVEAPAVRGVTPVEIGTGAPRALRRARRRERDAVVTGVSSFDARFLMTAGDPAAAARLLPPPVLDGFAVDPRTVGVGVRMADGTLTAFRCERLTVESLERLLAVAEALRAHLAALGEA